MLARFSLLKKVAIEDRTARLEANSGGIEGSETMSVLSRV